MNIGIDLDHTLAYFKLPFWGVAYELCGRLEKPKPPTMHGIADYPLDVQEMCIKLFNCRWFMVDLLESYVDSYQFLLQAKGETCSVHVITRRPEPVRDATRNKIMDLYGSMVQHLYFVDEDSHKLQLFRDLGLDVWIDDHAEVCCDASKLGIRTCMRTQPWNLYMNSPKIHRINKLTDVIEPEFYNEARNKNRTL